MANEPVPPQGSDAPTLRPDGTQTGGAPDSVAPSNETVSLSPGGAAFAHDIGAMHREFVKRLMAGEPPVVTTLEAWKTHRVCLAAEQSARRGSPYQG